MFTGIVTAIGRIASARPHGDGLRLRIDAPGFGMDDVALGDSIALQGVCHTVVAKDAGGFEVDTSAATLEVTTGLDEGREVNLEKSLTLADRLGGHLVSGHVDGVGTVTAFDDLGGSWRLEIEMPPRPVALRGPQGLDRGRRREPHGERGLGQPLRGEHHPAHAVGDHPAPPGSGKPGEPRGGHDREVPGAPRGRAGVAPAAPPRGGGAQFRRSWNFASTGCAPGRFTRT